MPEPVALYCTEAGAGLPVILLHGLFGNSRNLSALAKGLAKDFRVLTPDLRNHGRSPHAAIMDYPALAGDIIALLDKHDLQTAAIAGHSLGGKVAMATALLYPDRINRLVALDIAPVRYQPGSNNLIQHLLDLPLKEISSRTEADERLAESIPDERVRGFLLQNLEITDSGPAWRINLEALLKYRQTLGGFEGPFTPYHGPALILHGELSDYVRPEHHAVIRELFPEAVIQPIAGAGHWLHVDQPKTVLRVLVDFMAS